MKSIPEYLYPAVCLFVIFLSPGLWAQTKVTAATFGEIVEYPRVSASAIVLSPEETDLSARITARVERIAADVGAEIAAGDTLVELECTDYDLAERMAEAQLQAARANLTLAEHRHERAAELLEQKLTSLENVDTTTANLAAARAERNRAEAALDAARLDQSRCNVKAPFGGTVTDRYVSPGQLATSGTALVRLVNHRNLEVAARVSEDDLNTFDDTTDFVFNGMSRYPLRLQRVVKALDRETRTQEIRLVFTGDQPLPGTAGKVGWRSRIAHLARQYLVGRNGTTGYFTIADGLAEFVPLGDLLPEKAYPISLPPDTLIVTGGLQSLRHGTAVTVTDGHKNGSDRAD